MRRTSAETPRRRLPVAMSVALLVIGSVWLVAALMGSNETVTSSGSVNAMWLFTNAGGALLLLLTAQLGFLSRPSKPVAAPALALAVTVCAIPVLAAIFTARLAQQHGVASSAASDILVVTVAAIAAFAVFRSRPARG